MGKSFSQIQKEVARNFGIFITQTYPKYTKVSWKRIGDDIIVTYADGTVKKCEHQGAFYKTQMKKLADGETYSVRKGK